MEEQNKPILFLITGNSGSGKSFIGEGLIQQGIEEVLSFTTRAPRNDKEFDRYVFINEEQFKEKEKNGHFIETNHYKNNFYALTKFLPKGNCFAIVDPNGRDEVLRANIETHNIKTVFIEVDEEKRRERLIKRDGQISDRADDSFAPTNDCLIINGADSLEDNLNKILA